MAKWLIKSEPDSYSIEQLELDKKSCWDGVRNYQARNFLQSMKVGDEILFYHSSIEPIGVFGIAKVVKTAYPELSQFNPKHEYYDPKSPKDKPRWYSPDIAFVKHFKNYVPLSALRKEKALKNMQLLQKGSRLSVQPVTEEEFKKIVELGK